MPNTDLAQAENEAIDAVTAMLRSGAEVSQLHICTLADLNM